MKKKIFNGETPYVAPELVCTEISVEQGFAASGFGDPGRAGEDLSSEGNVYGF